MEDISTCQWCFSILWIVCLHNMQRREIMIAISSFIIGGIVVLLLLQESILSSATSRHHSENICNDVPSVLNALGVDNDSDIPLQQQSTAKVLSKNDHDELLLGYDLLTDIFSAQSRLWLVPILRKLARGTPLVIESTNLIHKLVVSGKHHKKQLLSKKDGLRNLQPNVSRHFIDANPNRLTDEMGKNIAWNIMSDLSTRGDEFDFHFALVHMASFRIIHSVSLALLEFETNEKRREWLKSVAEEYNQLRIDLRNTIMEYIRCEKDV